MVSQTGLHHKTKTKVHSKSRKTSENHSDSAHLPQGISMKGPAVSTALVLHPDVAPVRDAVHRPHFAHILKHTSDTQCISLYCTWCGAQMPFCPHTETHIRYTVHQSVLYVMWCTDTTLPTYWNTHQIHSAPVCTVGDAVHRPHFAHILKHMSDTQCTSLYCWWRGQQTPFCPHAETYIRHTVHLSVLLVMRCADPTLPTYWSTQANYSSLDRTVSSSAKQIPMVQGSNKSDRSLLFTSKTIREITPIH